MLNEEAASSAKIGRSEDRERERKRERCLLYESKFWTSCFYCVIFGYVIMERVLRMLRREREIGGSSTASSLFNMPWSPSLTIWSVWKRTPHSKIDRKVLGATYIHVHMVCRAFVVDSC